MIVDDQAVVRAGFRAILGAEPDLDVVGEAGDGAAALELLRSVSCDVVLMDIRMPRMDGLEATRRLRAPGPTGPANPRVLVLTTFDLDEYVFAALRAGASGFLLKDAEPTAIIDAVRVIAAGESMLAPTVTGRLIEAFLRTAAPDPGEASARLGRLSPREVEVLALMARGRSNSEIATELFVSDSTVKTHVNAVFTKLDARDRVQATILAYEAGVVRLGQR